MWLPTPTLLLSSLALLAAVATARHAAQDAGARDGERLRHLLKTEAAEIQALPDLTTVAAAVVLAESGVTSEALASLRRYEARMPGRREPLRVAFLDVRFRGRDLRLGLARDRRSGPEALSLYDDRGQPVADVDRFLDQFRGTAGIGSVVAEGSPVGEVIQRRDTLLAEDAPPPKPAERKAWVLLHHRQAMWRVDDAYQRALDANAAGTSPAPGLDQLVERLDELHGSAGQLMALLKPKEVGEYRKFIDEVKRDVEEARQAVTDDQPEKADKLVRARLKISCGKCHGWDGNQWRKPLQGAMREARERAGFADGALVVGVDVRALDLQPDEAQELASVVKAALLAATK